MKSKFTKVVVAVASLALAAGIMAGCSSTSSSSSSSAASSSAAEAADTSAEITELVVGFDDSYPPYGFIGTDGAYTGFDIELATKVAEENGWTVVPKPVDWDSKDAELNSGAINCIWNGFTIEGREDDYTFSDPYMLNEQVIVVRADSGITTWDDLADKVVITQAGSAALDLLQTAPDAEEPAEHADLAATFSRLDTIADYNNAFMMLEAGNVQAVACDLSIAAYQIAANPDLYVQLEEPLSSEHYGVGFKKGSQALADAVNATLKSLYESGYISELCEKYAPYGIDYNNWLIK